MSTGTVAYSLIVPLLNESDGLVELYRRLCDVMIRLDGAAEVVFVDDGSTDTSLDVLRTLAEKDKRVTYLSFARNFGHQIAVSAGLRIARGRAVIVLDADLQDPPELIPEMIARWRQGHQIVYAQRASREQERGPKRLLAYVFYRVLRRLSEVEIPVDAGDFCLLDRAVVDALNSMPERHRYLRGLRSWVGFTQTALRFDRAARFAGNPKYTLWKSSALAIDGVLSFSRMPLRVATYFGLFSAAFAAITMLLIVYWRFLVPQSPLSGFAFIAMVVFFIGAVQLVGIGILGEYIGRIYEEVKQRPLYTVKEQGGGDSTQGGARSAA